MKTSKKMIKSTKSQGNNKESNSKTIPKKAMITPENALKKLRVPLRLRKEPFKTLMIARKQPTITNDVAAAMELKREHHGGKKRRFLKIDLPGDLLYGSAYKRQMPNNFATTLFTPSVSSKEDSITYLYKTYNFMDDLTKYDIYRRAAYYATMVPRRLDPREEELMAILSMYASGDVRRRRNKLRLGGRHRPDYSNFGRRMLDSSRSLWAKNEKFNMPFFSQIVTSSKREVARATSTAMHMLVAKLKSDSTALVGRVKKFIKRNRKWVVDRMKCKRSPIFFKVARNHLQQNIINRHEKMGYRIRGDQDLFSEFNYLSSHLAFSVQFCRVLKNFKVSRVKEDAIIQKASNKKQPFLRVRMSRYSYFPAVSIVNFNEKDELQTALSRIPKKANSIAAFSGYSSDSAVSVATSTPLDWEGDWKLTDKEFEHRMNFLGDVTRATVRRASDIRMKHRAWKEHIRRRHLLYREDRRFELQFEVPILEFIRKMHPPLVYCRLKLMEIRKLRRSGFSDATSSTSSTLSPNETRKKTATGYLFRKRVQFLEKSLPCKNDKRIHLNNGWKTFGARENPENFKNIARILRQRSVWVSKNCLSPSAIIPRCDKLPLSHEGRHKKLFLVLIFVVTLVLCQVTMAMMSYL